MVFAAYAVVYSVLVTLERYGQIQTHLSLLLDIDDERPCPWSICLDDLEVILLSLKQHKNYKKKFIQYLSLREHFHDHMISDDEIELLGCFFQRPKELFKLSRSKEMVVFNPDWVTPISNLYFKGLGFKNEKIWENNSNVWSVW